MNHSSHSTHFSHSGFLPFVSPFKQLALMVLFICIQCFSQLSLAQIEEVFIEAEMLEEQTMDDLVSITAIDAEKLADAGIEDIEDAASYVPNLTQAGSGSGTQTCIRGLCPGFNQGFDSSVGIYIDSVPYPRSQMSGAPFLDLANLEVLRGPQFVLDGSYSIAGSIHLTSNLATEEFKSGIDFNYIPEQDSKKLLLNVGGPIVDDLLAANFVVQRKDSGGYMFNATTGERNTQEDQLLGRLVVGFTPGDDLNFKLKVEHSDFTTKGSNRETIADIPTALLNVTATHVFDSINGGPGGPVTYTRTPNDGLPSSPWHSESDLRNVPRGNQYRALLANEIFDSDGLFSNIVEVIPGVIPRRYAFIGKSWSQVLAEVYDLGYQQCLDGIAQETLVGGQPVSCNSADFELPPGLLDTELDFRRAADGEELSNNEAFNVTLNTEYYLGETSLKLTTAYVKYDFDSIGDGDGTAAPLFFVTQQETYDQSFIKLNFETPEGYFWQFKGGASYLQSALEFTDNFGFQTTNRDFNMAFRGTGSNRRFVRVPVERITAVGADGQPDITWGLFSRLVLFNGAGRGFSRFKTRRNFEQDTEITSLFLQSRANWTDNFYTELGLRYQHSEKSAVRDLRVINGDNSELDPAAILAQHNAERAAGIPINETILNTLRGYENNINALSGQQIHSDTLTQQEIDDLFGLNTKSVPAQKGTRREEHLLPSLRVNWTVNDSLSVFASAALAAKLGGYDARANTTPEVIINSGLPLGTFEFEEELATAYEVGGNWLLPDGIGQIKANIFLTKYRDLQVTRSDGRSGSNVDNAPAATSKGIEIEANAQFTDAFSANLSLAYIDFRYDEHKKGGCSYNQRPDFFFVGTRLRQDPGFFTSTGERIQFGDFVPIRFDIYSKPNDVFNSGTRISAAPRGDTRLDYYFDPEFTQPIPRNPVLGSTYPVDSWDYSTGLLPSFCDFSGKRPALLSDVQGTLSLNYQREVVGLGIFKPTLDIIYNSEYDTATTLDPAVRQDEFFLFNGRLQLGSFEDTWQIALTGQNLTNEKIISFAFETPFAAGVAGTQGYQAILRPPRTIGINLRYNFY